MRTRAFDILDFPRRIRKPFVFEALLDLLDGMGAAFTAFTYFIDGQNASYTSYTDDFNGGSAASS